MISIAIPAYEMHGKGVEFLGHSFDILQQQTYRDFEVVVSDHSRDNRIRDLCKSYEDSLNINYCRNSKNRGSSSANLNNAIEKCSGEYVKILFQDDYLYDDKSLQIIASYMENTPWLATGCMHEKDGTLTRPFTPRWNGKILYGRNTISSPSVITFRKDKFLPFDERLIWLMDCEWYWRMYKSVGKPLMIGDITVVNRIWGNSVSNTVSQKIKDSEYNLINEIYSETDV